MSTWYRDGKGGVIYTRKVSDGNYGSHEYGEWFEGEIGADTDIAKALGTMKAGVKQRVDKEIADFLNGASVDEIASELGAVVTEKVDASVPNAPKVAREEPPPLPGEGLSSDWPQPPEVAEPVRTPMDENGDEYDIFPVERIKIAVSDSGTKFAKVYGGRWQKFGVTVWEEVMEGVFPIGDMDVGHEFAPPQAMKAKAILNEKGNPKKVIEFQ